MTKTEKSNLIDSLIEDIDEAAAVEIHVETNSGTFGAEEACRKVGTGEPRFATRDVYETVGGKRRETGPGEEDAPGRMRKINQQEMGRRRKALASLRTQLERAFGRRCEG